MCLFFICLVKDTHAGAVGGGGGLCMELIDERMACREQREKCR